MNDFIGNILSRHLDPVANIVPRLPGKFEPVNFPAANVVEDFSAGFDTPQEVNISQGTAKPGKENNKETIFGAVTTVTPHNNSISTNQLVQQLNDDTAKYPENENAPQISERKNIIPVEHEFTGDKQVNQEASFGILNKQEIPVYSEIKLLAVNPVVNNQPKGNSLLNDFEQQKMPGSIFINKPDDTVIPAGKEGALHQHISILKQKIVKASAERRGDISEDKKTIQPGLIKPVMNNMNVRTNFNPSPVSNDQPVSSVIKVSIGRIEVRAITTAPPAKVNRTVLQKPNLTLDEYLKRRNSNGK
jgi:hypothetical protein